MYRRNEYVALDTAILQRMLQPLAEGCRITSVERLEDGAKNTNYKVGADGIEGSVVLRIHTHEAGRCEIESSVLRIIEGAVPVPRLLYADCTGSLYGMRYSILSWVDAIPLSVMLELADPEEAAETGEAVACALAAIGRFTFEEHGLFGPGLSLSTVFPSIASSVHTFVRESLTERPAGRRLGPVNAERIERVLSRHRDRLESLGPPYSLVHGDFSPENILVDRGGGGSRVAAVLDWESALSGPSLFDVGVLLRHRELLPPAFVSSFLESYRRNGGHLPPDWEITTLLLDFVSACDVLDDPGDHPQRFTAVVREVERTCSILLGEDASATLSDPTYKEKGPLARPWWR
jgi:aminoglycoside phosphotransferase (APT) family kinase protein